jgi:hypothetical protein
MKLIDAWPGKDYPFFLHKDIMYMQVQYCTGDDKLMWAIRADVDLPQPVICLYRKECKEL